jgi:hypothetical protein
MNNSLLKILEQMPPIHLHEMQNIRLMDRIDSKFTPQIQLLPQLLKTAALYYNVQIINKKYISSYATQYLDTPALEFFAMHANGNPNRQKIRIRSYLDSNISFLEIKNKNHKGRTRKIRIPVKTSRIQTISDLNTHLAFLNKHAILDAERLEPVLTATFDRITLVNPNLPERVTIDLNLAFFNHRTGQQKTIDNLSVLELKQDHRRASNFRTLLEQLNIQQVSFSKYYTGIAVTNPDLHAINAFLTPDS